MVAVVVAVDAAATAAADKATNHLRTKKPGKLPGFFSSVDVHFAPRFAPSLVYSQLTGQNIIMDASVTTFNFELRKLSICALLAFAGIADAQSSQPAAIGAAPVKVAPPRLDVVERAAPDLTFDSPAMLAAILTRPIIIKNVGNATSTTAQVSCTGGTQGWRDRAEEARRNGQGIVSEDPPSAISVPPIAPGQSYALQPRGYVADLIQYGCGLFSVAGDTNATNDQFNWKKQSVANLVRTDRAVMPAGTSPAINHLVFADLAFDIATMQADASRARNQVGYRVSVKNVGTRASTPTEMKCTDIADVADTVPGPNMGKMSRKTYSWTRAIPAVAANAAYADPVEVNGAEDLMKRTCVIDAANVSGDKNKGNNTFEYVNPKFYAMRVPRANLPVIAR